VGYGIIIKEQSQNGWLDKVLFKNNRHLSRGGYFRVCENMSQKYLISSTSGMAGAMARKIINIASIVDISITPFLWGT